MSEPPAYSYGNNLSLLAASQAGTRQRVRGEWKGGGRGKWQVWPYKHAGDAVIPSIIITLIISGQPK